MTSEDGDVVICRACLSDCMEYKSIYRQGIIMGELTTLAAMLTYCTNLNFPEEELLPSNMCNTCVVNLAKLYVFKQTVIKSNETLRNQHCELGDDQEFEVIHAITENEESQHKDDHDRSYVTLTVVEESKLEPQNFHLRNDSIGTNEGEIEHEVGPTEDQQIRQILEDGEQVDIYQEEELELTDNFKEEDDCDSETYVVTLQDDQQSALATSVSLSETEEEHPTIKAIKKRSAENMTTGDFLLAKRFRTVKTRTKSSGVKPANPDLQCQVCGKQLSNPNSFRYHMQLHSDATPFLCSLCGEGFKTRNAYEGHMSLHDPNNPNTCELCGKSYRQASSLRAHMLTHTGEKPFQCDICGKGMTQKSGYKKHMLTHTGEKPHNCDICGRAFRYSSNLISHRRHHSGEKPYDCPLCEKSFSTAEQLKRHTRVHTGEKPFSCEVCNRRFNRRSSLVAHRNTHNVKRVSEKKSIRLKEESGDEASADKQVRCVEYY